MEDSAPQLLRQAEERKACEHTERERELEQLLRQGSQQAGIGMDRIDQGDGSSQRNIGCVHRIVVASSAAKVGQIATHGVKCGHEAADSSPWLAKRRLQ